VSASLIHYPDNYFKQEAPLTPVLINSLCDENDVRMFAENEGGQVMTVDAVLQGQCGA